MKLHSSIKPFILALLAVALPICASVYLSEEKITLKSMKEKIYQFYIKAIADRRQAGSEYMGILTEKITGNSGPGWSIIIYHDSTVEDKSPQADRDEITEAAKQFLLSKSPDWTAGDHDRDIPVTPPIEPADMPGIKTLKKSGDTASQTENIASRSHERNNILFRTEKRGSGAVFSHGPRLHPEIALTFDAGKAGKYDPNNMKIIDILKENKIPATFFLSGKWVEANRSMTEAISRTPYFELANHTHRHRDLTTLPANRIQDEVVQAQDSMMKITGRSANLFRPPFGKYNNRIKNIVSDLGLKLVMWDVETDDYKSRTSADDIVRAAVTQARNGSIIILHMNDTARNTHIALPEIIKKLRDKGHRFVKVSDLIGLN